MVYSRWDTQWIFIRLRGDLNGGQLNRKNTWQEILKTISGKTLVRKSVTLLNSCRAKVIAWKTKMCICCQLQHCIEIREPKV